MLLTGEQIKEIEDMAQLFFTIDQIAINTEIDPQEFRDEVESRQGPAYLAYITGWFRGEIPLRKSIAEAAANGSNPAQQMLIQLINNANTIDNR